jgi:hypothetical protein
MINTRGLILFAVVMATFLLVGSHGGSVRHAGNGILYCFGD